MSGRALYDEDILLWSEQQAGIVRGLARTRRGLPNDFDVENVAEEIESVGRSELAAVQSQIRNILVHLLKIAGEPESEAVRHWRAEITAFHAELVQRYTPSMRHRIDLDRNWKVARRIAMLDVPEGSELFGLLPEAPPLPLDSLLDQDIDSAVLAHTLRQHLASEPD